MTALFRRVPHDYAARFSFVMSIPAITAAGVFQLFDAKDELATHRHDADPGRDRGRVHLRLGVDLLPAALPAHAHDAHLHLLPLRPRRAPGGDAC